MEELNPRGHLLSDEVIVNMHDLISKMSIFRNAYGNPMIVTDCFRTADEHRAIYHNTPKIPWGSMHLIGCAVDVWDRNKRLAAFAKSNENLLKEIGLWCEEPTYTRTWLHFQTRSPASGMRFFKPW
jgi:hypothetical protein